MADQSPHAESTDPRVEAALREYLERVERGEAVDREEFISRHVEIADILRSFFASREPLGKVGVPKIPHESDGVATRSFSAHGQETLPPRPNSDRSPPAATGTELQGQFGRYQITRALGKGAMGAVYLAHDTQLKRNVAIKVPHFDDDPTGELLSRFYREAEAAATLRHANTCPVYDVGQIDGRHFISMAYIEGRPLSDFVRSSKRQTERQILIAVHKLALALQEAHDHGIVHRDLKPANIMVDKKGEPIIMDFGLARKRRSEGEASLTQTGVILGSPAYMSPEQVEGDPDSVGSASDQYSLGVVLYEMLTGQLPFRGSLVNVLAQIITKDPTQPSELRAGLDPRIEAACLRMMAKRASDRFPSMKAVADQLAAIVKSSARASIAAAPTPAEMPPTVIQPPALRADGEAATRNGSSHPFTRLWREGGWTRRGVLALGLAVVAVVAGVLLNYLGREQASKLTSAGDQQVVTIPGRQEKPLKATPDIPVVDRSARPRKLSPDQRTHDTGFRDARDAAQEERSNPSAATNPHSANDVSGSSADSDRRTAEAALALGSRIAIRTDATGHDQWIEPNGQLPQVPFQLTRIRLRSNPRLNDAALMSLGAPKNLLGLSAFMTNQITDAGLGQLHNLTALEDLALTGTGATDWVLTQMDDLKQLKNLDLIGVKVTDAGLAHLKGRTKLTALHLGFSRVTDAGLANLEGLVNLRELNLGEIHKGLTDAGLKHLRKLPRLRLLNLGGTQVTSAGLSYLDGMTSLEHLDLHRTRVRMSELDHLPNLPLLKRLDLGNLDVTDDDLVRLQSLKSLEWLNLEGARVSGPGLAYLKVMPRLRELELNNSHLSDSGLEHLSKLTQLKKVSLAGTSITDAGLHHLETMTNLAALDLTGTKISAKGLEEIRQALPACRIAEDPVTR